MTGTFGISDITLYKMDGEFYARSKSTLTGKRVKMDKAFEGTRRSSERFKRGNELASQVYQAMAEEKRFYKLYCRLKREAILYLKCGKTEDEVLKELEIICDNPQTPTCHLNLSLPATVPPVPYRDWYRQKEKVYAYNYDNQKPIKRRQRVLYFEGSEDIPLNVSQKDIWDISEGTEEDMLGMKKRMEQRLARKQKQLKKDQSLPVDKAKEITVAAPKPAGRKIIKHVVLKPRWRKPFYQPPTTITTIHLLQKHKFVPAPT